VITYETLDDCVIITATGAGTVTMYVNNELVENPYTVMRGEEATSVIVTAYAQEEGKEISAATTVEVPIPALVPITPPEPEQTPMPEINYEVNDDAVIITATGEGEVLLYVNGELVENPCTIERGAEDVEIVVTATAQGEDMLISEVATMNITIPAKAEPVVQEGIFIVLVDQYGEEHMIELAEGTDGSYITTVTLEYDPWGSFFWDPNLTEEENNANRPDVPFYFLVDGVRYGASEALVDTYLGNAMFNPLTDEVEDGFYTVPVGFAYTLGVAVVGENDYYVYAAVSKKTGVDEMNADKTVASKRFFNMAGQEMQEVNGATIVVTTYTDGTRTTAKVIK
jgi:hypothetical protein